MKKWLNSALIIGSATLIACASQTAHQQNTSTGKNPPGQVSVAATVVRSVPEFRADAPGQYVVRRGDTLWGIAQKFLKNPGRWKEIWHANPGIKNPHWIYPGDVIAFTTVGGKRKLHVASSSNPVREKHTGKRTSDGRPVYNLSPSVRIEELEQPVPTVPKDIVYPFMTKNRIMEPGFSEEFPYVIGQADGGFISLTVRDQVYAKGETFDQETYDVFREATPIKDPIDGEFLGVEATYVGQLQMVKSANEDGIATFAQTDRVNPLYPKDVLLPATESEIGGNLNFMPKLPVTDAEVVVIKPMGTFGAQAGTQLNTILINAGTDDNVSEGDVFGIVRAAAQTGKGRHGETFKLPDYDVGYAIVYKTHENTSYALIMSATDLVYSGDRLVTP